MNSQRLPDSSKSCHQESSVPPFSKHRKSAHSPSSQYPYQSSNTANKTPKPHTPKTPTAQNPWPSSTLPAKSKSPRVLPCQQKSNSQSTIPTLFYPHPKTPFPDEAN